MSNDHATRPDSGASAARLITDLSERVPALAGGHAVAVRGMFDRISPTYDLLNRLLSFGTDRAWRARALSLLAAALPEGPLLDSCAGTLDLTLAMQTRWPERGLVAADFAREMLLAGRRKLKPRAAAAASTSRTTTTNPTTSPTTTTTVSSGETRLVVCDAMRLPFPDGSFAGMTCGFGLRNLADPARGVAEAHRVLMPKGVLVVLELFRPTRAWTRAFHALYGRALLPFLGRIVSGDHEAYGYLSRSMRGFMTRAEMEQVLRAAGFSQVRGVDLTLGVASIVWGIK